jgi:hypothetical protein
MPVFKSTWNILKKPDEDEVYHSNWMDSDTVVVPPTVEWDYKREMTIEDVDIWEVLNDDGGCRGVYAAWCPYAEFYLITTGPDYRHQWYGELNGITYNYNDRHWETYYGPGSEAKVKKRMEEMNLPFATHKVWVDDEDMWIYQTPDDKPKTIILPSDLK